MASKQLSRLSIPLSQLGLQCQSMTSNLPWVRGALVESFIQNDAMALGTAGIGRLGLPSLRMGFATTTQGDEDSKATEKEPSESGAAAASGGNSGDEAGASGEQATQAERDATEANIDSLGPEELKEALKQARESVAAEKSKVDELKQNLLRTLADMENLRERTKRQTAEARQFAIQGLVESLVEVADNLERAAGSVTPTLDAMDKGGSEAEEIDRDRALGLLRSLRDGVLLTDGILMRILGEQGVKRFDPMGEKFDPNFHNALFEVSDGTKEVGTVAIVVKKGYLLHDRAVRAADVGVVREDSDDNEG